VNLVRGVLLVAAALAATIAWPARLSDLGLRPDWLLLVALAAGVLGDGAAGAWTGIAGGLAAAPLTLEPFGFDAALLGMAGGAAGRLGALVRADRAIPQMILAGSLALLVAVARCVRLEAAAEGASFAGMLPAAFAGALGTAAAAPAVLFVLDGSRLFRKPRDEPWRRSLV
jgi:cell shape-determining protein MreD